MLLTVVPMVASAADLFENWLNDKFEPGNNNMSHSVASEIAAGNYILGDGFSFVSDGTVGVTIKAHYWEGANVSLGVMNLATGTATQLLTTDNWNSALTLSSPNNVILHIDDSKAQVKDLGFAKGTEFAFYLTVGNQVYSSAVLIDNYVSFGGQKGAILGFDISGKGTYDDFVIMLGNSNVTAVPEPETWAMLLAGLGIVGAVARRRKQS
jgi:hypothetical protein